MNQWEYKRFYFEMENRPFKKRIETLEKKLNEIGKEGWEVYHQNEDKGVRYIFVTCWAKRKVEGGPYR
jgi:glutamate/tyrosine decarboxylase-like PLP-dependent enzyme